VCAHVDEGVNFRNVPKPKGEREQCVTRRQSRVVIGCSAIRRPAPVRRERDDNVTERPRTEVECAVTHITVVFDVAPCVLHPLAEVPRTGSRREDATAITREIARAFERAISASPPDWHLFQPGWSDQDRT